MRSRLLALVALAASLAGCTPAATPDTALLVFAASSLTAPFRELGTRYETLHPGVRVSFSFDGSQALAQALAEGAPADVFASADRATMDAAVAAGSLAGVPLRFASNVLVLVVPAGNPAGITGLDGSLAGRKLVVCAPQVPCGAATARLADLLGVSLQPVSEETRVSDVRAKVETGQADAGVVYLTDARAAGAAVEAIALPRSGEVANEYLVGATAASHPADVASDFASFVAGPEGRAVLAALGFGP